jgi:hypothetical protein
MTGNDGILEGRGQGEGNQANGILQEPRERKRTRKTPTGCNCTNSRCDRHNNKAVLNNGNGVNNGLESNPPIPPKAADNLKYIDMTTDESVAASIAEKKRKEKEFLRNASEEMKEFLKNIPEIMRDEVLMQMMLEKVRAYMFMHLDKFVIMYSSVSIYLYTM